MLIRRGTFRLSTTLIECLKLLRSVELPFERDSLSNRKKGLAFARALLRQWWLLVLPVLSLISTAVTFVVPLWPQFHLPEFAHPAWPTLII